MEFDPQSIVERLQHSASVDTVFGDPISEDGKTVVPVARVAYGFGGGFGSGGPADDASGDETGGEGDAGGEGGEGGGGGGGVSATPVGVVELTESGTRFVRFEDRRRLGTALFAGVVLGYLLGRRR